jgi:RNA polymerase sigma-70 factor (ECF subfamily)
MKTWESELAGLVEHRGAALLRYATMLCGNPRDAEDLVQDAVVKVFSRLRGPAGRTDGHPEPGAVTLVTDTALTNLEGYVRRAILTGYLDTYRRRRRWAGIRHLSARPDHVVGHEDGVGDRADVTAALAALTPTQRACVVLRFYSDLTVPQVAADWSRCRSREAPDC